MTVKCEYRQLGKSGLRVSVPVVRKHFATLVHPLLLNVSIAWGYGIWKSQMGRTSSAHSFSQKTCLIFSYSPGFSRRTR